MKIKFSILISLLLIIGLISILPVYATENYLYEDLILSRFADDEDIYDDFDFFYEESFYYYSDNTNQIPNYALICVFRSAVPDICIHSYFGEYVIVTGPYSPYKHGYYIYTPTDDKLYTLEEAYYAEIEGITEALRFLNGGHVAMVGDSDADFNLSIKDATYIQKYLAGINYNCSAHYWGGVGDFASDFNRDTQINIKDATAIQKHLVGLEY